VVAISSDEPGGGPDTTVTFTVTSGDLTMSAPVTADLGSGAPGTTISGNLGTVTVTGNRALLTASWTTTVTWNPVIQISIPDGAVAGTYSATVVHSVS
jgi:hypothetical protein